jgi:AraC-like DNA-binding protein
MVQPGEVHSNWSGAALGCGYWMTFVDAELMRRAAEEVSGKKSDLPFFPTAVVFDQRLIRKYLDLQFALVRPSSTLERESLLANFLTDLILRFSESRPAQPSDGVERHAVRRACEYVVEHYDENVSLAALARVANLSSFHLNRVFSKQLGMPPHEFQIQVRVSRAKALLRQGWSISQVASQTGFADQSHLTRHFKRLVIVTPGAYRENSKNVQDGPGL